MYHEVGLPICLPRPSSEPDSRPAAAAGSKWLLNPSQVMKGTQEGAKWERAAGVHGLGTSSAGGVGHVWALQSDAQGSRNSAPTAVY